MNAASVCRRTHRMLSRVLFVGLTLADVRLLYGMRTEIRIARGLAVLHRHVRFPHVERGHRRPDILRSWR